MPSKYEEKSEELQVKVIFTKAFFTSNMHLVGALLCSFHRDHYLWDPRANESIGENTLYSMLSDRHRTQRITPCDDDDGKSSANRS